MNLKDFETGLLAFAENYVLPNLTNSTDRWLMYFGMAAGGLKLEQTIQSVTPMLSEIGLIGKDGEIDLDALERYGKAAFQKQPKVKLWKLTFSEPDFEALMAHMKTGVGQPVEQS